MSGPALVPTQPPIQWVPGALPLGVKRPGREADLSPPSSAEVKEHVELYLHSPNTSSWRGARIMDLLSGICFPKALILPGDFRSRSLSSRFYFSVRNRCDVLYLSFLK
jgi:hypothetical protein